MVLVNDILTFWYGDADLSQNGEFREAWFKSDQAFDAEIKDVAETILSNQLLKEDKPYFAIKQLSVKNSKYVLYGILNVKININFLNNCINEYLFPFL